MLLIDVNFDDPAIEVRHTSVGIPGVVNWSAYPTHYYDGLLICTLSTYRTVVWNPLLRQGRQIMSAIHVMTRDDIFLLCGIGYDTSTPKMGYKMFGYYLCSPRPHPNDRKLVIYESASDMWKFINVPYEEWPIKEPLDNHLSFKGNSYWTAYNIETGEYCIRRFDFSRETLNHFCILPCKKNHERDTHYLSIVRGSRFSMLEQCYETRKIEIWVTKNKLKNGDEEDVVWIKFMTVSIPDIPKLFHQFYGRPPSYFVDDISEKTFAMYCFDETRQACIYIVRGDLSRKMKVNSVVAGFSHCIYVPNLIPISWESSNQDNNNGNLDL